MRNEWHICTFAWRHRCCGRKRWRRWCNRCQWLTTVAQWFHWCKRNLGVQIVIVQFLTRRFGILVDRFIQTHFRTWWWRIQAVQCLAVAALTFWGQSRRQIIRILAQQLRQRNWRRQRSRWFQYYLTTQWRKTKTRWKCIGTISSAGMSEQRTHLPHCLAVRNAAIVLMRRCDMFTWRVVDVVRMHWMAHKFGVVVRWVGTISEHFHVCHNCGECIRTTARKKRKREWENDANELQQFGFFEQNRKYMPITVCK